MKIQKTKSTQLNTLRRRAEDLVKKNPSTAEKFPPRDVQHLLEEFKIHQVELEIQNEELRRALLELEASRDKYSDLYDFAPVGYVTVSEKGLVLQTNLTCAAMLGVERRSLIGKPFSQFIKKDDQDIFYLHRKMLFETKAKQVCEVMLERKDRTHFYAQLESIVATDTNGDFAHNRTTITDINERKLGEEALKKVHDELEQKVKERTAELVNINEELKTEIDVRKYAEKILQRNENLLQTVFDGISDPLVLLDDNLRVKILNDAALRYYQKEKKGVINSCCYQAFRGKSKACDGCRVPRAVSHKQSISFERTSPKDPDRLEQVIVYKIDGKDSRLCGAIIRIHDITDTRLMEREMIHAEKLASLGLMVSCITHEITNPIGTITFNAPILKDYINAMIDIIDDHAKDRRDFELFRLPYPQFRKDADKIVTNIIHGAKRVGNILSNLRRIYQKEEEEKKQWFNLKSVIETTVSLMRIEISRYVNVFETNLPENLPEIYAVPDSIEQILINLLTNAAHAVDKEDSKIKLEVIEGNTWHDHLIIEVSDNGCGMDKETRSKIFNPFFSTKPPDQGTGLGLFVCQNLIEKLDGRVEVQSEVGKGSVFRVTLPDVDRRSVRRL